jgi:hypothetical protein
MTKGRIAQSVEVSNKKIEEVVLVSFAALHMPVD